jgi:hypothetical protein
MGFVLIAHDKCIEAIPNTSIGVLVANMFDFVVPIEDRISVCVNAN